MHSAYERVFQWRAGVLMSERYDDLASQFTLPVEIDIVGHRTTFACRDDLALYFRRYHVALKKKGVDGLEARVVAVGLNEGQRQRVWVRWLECDHLGCKVGISQAVYTCIPCSGGPLTSKVEYTQFSMTEFAGLTLQRRLKGMR
jgi:hypothetical protein